MDLNVHLNVPFILSTSFYLHLIKLYGSSPRSFTFTKLIYDREWIISRKLPFDVGNPRDVKRGCEGCNLEKVHSKMILSRDNREFYSECVYHEYITSILGTSPRPLQV